MSPVLRSQSRAEERAAALLSNTVQSRPPSEEAPLPKLNNSTANGLLDEPPSATDDNQSSESPKKSHGDVDQDTHDHVPNAQELVSQLFTLLDSKPANMVYTHLYVEMDLETLIDVLKVQGVVVGAVDENYINGLIASAPSGTAIAKDPVEEPLAATTQMVTNQSAQSYTVLPHAVLYFGFSIGEITGSCVDVISGTSLLAQQPVPYRIADVLFAMSEKDSSVWTEYIFKAYQRGIKPHSIHVGYSEVPIDVFSDFTSPHHAFQSVGTLQDIYYDSHSPYQHILRNLNLETTVEGRAPFPLYAIYLYTAHSDLVQGVIGYPMAPSSQASTSFNRFIQQSVPATQGIEANLQARFQQQFAFLGTVPEKITCMYDSFLMVNCLYTIWGELGIDGMKGVATDPRTGNMVKGLNVVCASPLGSSRIGTVGNHVTLYKKAVNVRSRLGHLNMQSLTTNQSRFIKIWDCYQTYTWQNPLPSQRDINAGMVKMDAFANDAATISIAKFKNILTQC
ncbi:hypothetical protein K474DRAFT_1710802 [Panus rudis PR-1116 ss-1]|nr:hypothetical protein K474DRAFT_1710802 [Panus rudis PR-1116 ss-1]